jgi:Ca2+-binding RTX toxin-like protein/murein DD-endopeptidase MepM/ murein hydrolase activator NlpD
LSIINGENEMSSYDPGSKFRLIRPAGQHTDPNSGPDTAHRGEDWAAQAGTAIPAAAAGQVVFSGWMQAYGNTLAVRHTFSGGDYYTLYARLREPPSLPREAWVDPGQHIGLTGSTGARNSHPHLHFEVLPGPGLTLLKGQHVIPPAEFDFADPLAYFQRPEIDSRWHAIDPAAHSHFFAARKAAPPPEIEAEAEADAESDAYLVLDRNGNGRIDAVDERFNAATPLENGGLAVDGFAALAAEDRNGDGQVDAADAGWAALRLWHDRNRDGRAQPDELSTLAEHGMKILNVSRRAQGMPRVGIGGFLRDEEARARQTAVEWPADGEAAELLAAFAAFDSFEEFTPFKATAQHLDHSLALTPFYNDFLAPLPLTAAAQRLPTVQGAGQVRELRQAASLQTPAGEALVAALAAFASAGTRSQQMSLLDDLLKAWAATSRMPTTGGALLGDPQRLSIAGLTPDSPAWWAWVERLNILERFNGRPLMPLPAPGAEWTLAIHAAQKNLLDAAYAALKDSVYGALALQTRLQAYLDAVTLKIDAHGARLDFAGLEAALAARQASDPLNALVDRIELLRYAGRSLQDAGWQGFSTLGRWIAEAENAERWKSVRLTLGPTYRQAATAGADFHLMGSARGLYGSGPGDDVVIGGGGDNLIYSDSGADLLNGGGGDDRLYAGAGDDTLIGGAGNDALFGGSGDDDYVFSRGDGRDVISDGGDRWFGPGGGVDSVRFLDVKSTEVSAQRSGRALLLNYGAGDQLTITDQFTGGRGAIEDFEFSDGVRWDQAWLEAHLSVRGTAGDDALGGLPSPDRIYGLDGNDRLMGRAGDDLLIAGAGNDTLRGGLGDDILDACAGLNSVYGGPGDDTVYGGMGDDTVYGGPGNDRLHGDDGHDLIFGNAGNDRLYGEAGNDILDGGSGHDSLHNSSGTALLNGGRGNDTLSGGASAELFLGGPGDDIYTVGHGDDLILFNKGDGQDTLRAADQPPLPGTGQVTLSLGGGIVCRELALSRAANDLVLRLGDSDQITFQDWYTTGPARPARPVTRVQVIADAMSAGPADSEPPQQAQTIRIYDFSALVTAFDAARTAEATLEAWSLCAMLPGALQAELNQNPDQNPNQNPESPLGGAAIGGDLAYQYGRTGSLRGLPISAMQALIDDPRFGNASQPLPS